MKKALIMALVPAVALTIGMQRPGRAEAFGAFLVGSQAELAAALGRTLRGAFPDAPPDWEVARRHRFDQHEGVLFRLVSPEQLTGGRNWFQLRSEAAAAKSYLLPVDIFWEDSVWVTLRPLGAGDCLTAQDVARRTARHTEPPGQVQFASAPVGLCVQKALGEGTVLTHELLAPPPVIDRGRIVHLVYQSPGLRVVARAEALECGGLGQTIRVRPLDGRRSCQGVIRSADEVEVIAP